MATTSTSTATSSSSSVFDAINTAANTKTASTKTSEMQDRFLTLLTTQLKNQDPLNPMDNAQMTSQLAQISTVDGIERLNSTLSQLTTSNADTQTLQAAALVGHGALVSGKALELTASGALGGYELATGADVATIEVRDANGALVRTISEKDLAAGVHSFVWDGKDDSGNAMAAGSYNFGVAATQGKDTVTATSLNFGYISGVVRSSAGVLGIDVGSYGRFSLTDLKQII